MITAIYPGTYDPVTNGHIDVITRAADIFDRVVVGVVGKPQHKDPMFTLDERVGFLRDSLDGLGNVEVDVFSELVVDFARKWDEGDRQGPARDLGLRVGVPDEPAQPDARARGRDGLRDGEPAGQLRLLERREGDSELRRKGRRARAGRGRTQIRGAVSRRAPGDAGEPAGMSVGATELIKERRCRLCRRRERK